MVQESRKSGNRTVEIALAEIRILSKNVYVERAERKLTEVRDHHYGVVDAVNESVTLTTPFRVLLQEEIPECSCLPPKEGSLGCLEDCVNRAVRCDAKPEPPVVSR